MMDGSEYVDIMAMEASNSSEFYRASSFSEAATLLREHDAVIIAGGQSMMPLLRQGMIDTDVIVDISTIEGHDEIEVGDDELSLGALVTHTELVESDLDETPWRALRDAAKVVGDRQVRNWGTVGGSIAHADPSLDYPPTMIVMDAEVECSNGEETEYVPLEEFAVGEYVNVLDEDQLVTGVRIPRPPEGSGVGFEKFGWREADYSLVNVATRLTVDGSEITEARICVGCMGPTPIRMAEMEEALVGSDVDDTERQERVADHVDEFTQPVGEQQASVEYKNRLAKRLMVKALRTAAERATEGDE